MPTLRRTSTRHDLETVEQAPASPRVTDELLRALGPVVYACEAKDGLIKIGHTTDLARRLRQVGSGHRSLLAFKMGTLEDEAAIHAALDGHAARGKEWYPWTPSVLAIVNDMRSAFGLTLLAERD